jgi:hypothetical protein
VDLDINVVMGFLMLFATLFVGWATLKVSRATDATTKVTDALRETIIQPHIITWIRPAQDYFRIGLQQGDWKSGVGIYVENVGNGTAIDVKVTCKVGARTETMIIQRLYPHQRYTYPSVDQPQLVITEKDSSVDVELEYRSLSRMAYPREVVTLPLRADYFQETPRFR